MKDEIYNEYIQFSGIESLESIFTKNPEIEVIRMYIFHSFNNYIFITWKSENKCTVELLTMDNLWNENADVFRKTFLKLGYKEKHCEYKGSYYSDYISIAENYLEKYKDESTKALKNNIKNFSKAGEGYNFKNIKNLFLKLEEKTKYEIIDGEKTVMGRADGTTYFLDARLKNENRFQNFSLSNSGAGAYIKNLEAFEEKFLAPFKSKLEALELSQKKNDDWNFIEDEILYSKGLEKIIKKSLSKKIDYIYNSLCPECGKNIQYDCHKVSLSEDRFRYFINSYCENNHVAALIKEKSPPKWLKELKETQEKDRHEFKIFISKGKYKIQYNER